MVVIAEPIGFMFDLRFAEPSGHGVLNVSVVWHPAIWQLHLGLASFFGLWRIVAKK
jgi:hypothetical protein